MNKTKKILAIALSLCLVLSLVPLATFATEASIYDGTAVTGEVADVWASLEADTANKVVTIDSAEELAKFVYIVDNIAKNKDVSNIIPDSKNSKTSGLLVGWTVQLTTDIVWNAGDASAWTATEGPANAWNPIGDFDRTFGGTFDGQDHTISGLYNGNASGDFGFFASSGHYMTVKNLNLDGVVFFGAEGTEGIGALIGWSNRDDEVYTTLENVHVTNGNINAGGRVGGLVGVVGDTASFINCSFSGSVNATKERAGGIAGQVQWSARFEGCSVSGVVSASAMAGGIAANFSGGEAEYVLKNCVVDADVLASYEADPIAPSGYAGGLVGYIGSPTKVSGCVVNGYVTAICSYAGGVAGFVDGVLEVSNCVINSGITAGYQYTAGITSFLGSGSLTVSDCVINGNCKGTASYASGIVAQTNPEIGDIVVNNVVVNGNMEGVWACSITGYLKTNLTVNNFVFNGTITGHADSPKSSVGVFLSDHKGGLNVSVNLTNCLSTADTSGIYDATKCADWTYSFTNVAMVGGTTNHNTAILTEAPTASVTGFTVPANWALIGGSLAPVSAAAVDLDARILLEEGVAAAGAFNFAIYAADASGNATGDALQTATNDMFGFVDFDDIALAEAGETYYVVKQVIPAATGDVEYDDTVYVVKVTTAAPAAADVTELVAYTADVEVDAENGIVFVNGGAAASAPGGNGGSGNTGNTGNSGNSGNPGTSDLQISLVAASLAVLAVVSVAAVVIARKRSEA